MAELSVVFLGNDPWSALALQALTNGEDPINPSLVLTRVPRPAGRGSALRPTAVADIARDLRLPLAEIETVREGGGLRTLREVAPDVLAVVAYGEILPVEVLELARLGSVNLHFSLLPRWRGASPVQHAIWEGDEVTGVTTTLMDEGLDTGPVLQRAEERVGARDDAGSLGARLAAKGGALLADTIRGLATGALTPVPQPPQGVTYAPKLKPGDRVIAWTDPAATIDRRVRALSPTPGATTTFRGGGLKVARGEPLPGAAEPGRVLPADPSEPGVQVGTGGGVYRLLEVAPAGRNRMAASDWARGARFLPGESLG